ncbi:MAG: endonuclease/exonuclease/phosphatase family protein [Coleofasciculus sp. G3-WIS-01]|uniref:endonuclease/exonuclease/phosphatase family protein n=1 Tax=Coleofasciculus sp. G3-WIS-01 TaxID=3069528 RepID=UPI0032F6DE80
MKQLTSVKFFLTIFLAGSIFLLGGNLCANASELKVASFNVESGDAVPSVIARKHIAPLEDIDIWGFSEVQNETWLTDLEQGTEEGENADFQTILGRTGRGDRLAIAYNSNLLEEVKHYELDDINIGGRVRAPLVAQFRFKPTGEEFLFVVNHLYRTSESSRHEQARLLNEWGRSQELPIIAAGDYNFDWDVISGVHDEGWDFLTADDVFTWVKPEKLIATICSNRYNGVLDFVFVAGEAKNWSASSVILYGDPSDAYCPDDQTTSDHRPILATFELGESVQPTPPNQQQVLLEQIEQIERELLKLKMLVEGRS